MAETLTEAIRNYLKARPGREVSYSDIRKELRVDPDSTEWDYVRKVFDRLVDEKLIKPSGRRDGIYKVIVQVKPVQVFGEQRERRPPFELFFPRDFDTQMEMPLGDAVVVREGDVILIGGVSNWGKTTLALNFAAENIEKKPVLLGNEYTSLNEKGIMEPTVRFVNRLEAMDWINWRAEDGNDKFTLLPVWEDYEDHIIRDRINIIDWVNLPGEYWMISPLMEKLKKAVGRGVLVLVMQKNAGLDHVMGGGSSKHFVDCEMLLDKFSETETLLSVGKVKEATKPIMGKKYAFGIFKGVQIKNFREVKPCPACRGKKFTVKGECDNCQGHGFIDA